MIINKDDMIFRLIKQIKCNTFAKAVCAWSFYCIYLDPDVN